MKACLGVLFLIFISLHASALVGGQAVTGMSSVINYKGCTYFFVGLNPPTLMTAKHCIAGDVHPPGVVKIIKAPFKYSSQEMAGDVAILIYPKTSALRAGVLSADIFSVAPVSLKEKDRVFLCGFGATNYSHRFRHGGGVKRCGSAFLVTENLQYRFRSPRNQVESIHAAIQSTLAAFGGLTHYAIGRFNQAAFTAAPADAGFDKAGENVLTNVGDSGGPWFVRGGSKENPLVFAVDSFGWELDNFKQDVVAGFATRLDHPWSQALLVKAQSEGADILGLRKTLP